MFPLNNDTPYRENDGDLKKLGDVLGGGGGGYVLPTASSETKGGIKVGDGLTMNGDTLNVDEQIPEYSTSQAGMVLMVGDEGGLVWSTVSGGNGRVSKNLTKESPIIDAKGVTT